MRQPRRRPCRVWPPARARRLRPSAAGITLIEVVAATAIIGIGLVGVGSIVTYAVISHRKAVEHTIASARATQELERVREAGYLGAVVDESLFPADSYETISPSQVSFAADELDGGFGYVTITDDAEAQYINPGTGQPYGNMKHVVVHLFWDRPGDKTMSYSIATLISNRP